MAGRFTVGGKFDSFAQLEQELDFYKRSTFSDFFIKDCRTLAAAKKRYPVRVEKADEALKYYFVKFMCVSGGRYKKRPTTGERNTSSMRQGCNAYIYIKLSDDGKNLVITDMSENHNHELSQELFDFLPRQRRLAPDVQQEVLDMLELNADKKLVQEKYSSELKKKITLRDLSNLKAKGNAKQTSFEEIVSTVQKDHDCTVKVMLDEHQNLRALFLQDKKMQKEFEAYPEVLFADCTYKLTDLRTPIFVLMVENGNGESNVVAAGVFISEEKDIYQWFLESFKSLNPSSVETKIVMTDKDMTERVVFKEVLPNVRLRICLFHTLKIFRREISAQEMGLSPQEVVLIRTKLQKMCYATSLEEFNELYDEFKDISPLRVIQYFAKNWKENIDEWTMISDFQADTLFNRTNNRVESFNAKLKSVVTHFSSLDKFLKHFFVVIKCLRLEREANRAKVLSRFSTQTFQSEEEQLYSLYATPYAFHLIEKQFQSLSVVTQEMCIKYATTENYCRCSFFNSLHLPCKHILKKREVSKTSLYEENLVNLRWSRKYLGLTREPPRQSVQPCTVDVVPRTVAISTQQKFRKARVITNKLATLISESSQAEIKIMLLENIYEKWARGEEVTLLCNEDSLPQNLSPPIGDQDDHDLPNGNQEVDEHQDDHQDTPPTSDQGSSQLSHVAFEHCYANIQSMPISTFAAPTEVVAETSCQSILRNIQLPSKVKVRGRPKGSTLTAIGLPRAQKGKKKAFLKKQHNEKTYIILSWFVSEEVVQKVKKGYLINECDIECRPEKIHCGAVDESVDLFIVRPFFAEDGWTMLLNVVENKKQNNVWVCDICNQNVTECSICCDSCLSWYHFKCVGVKNAPKKEWFCVLCK